MMEVPTILREHAAELAGHTGYPVDVEPNGDRIYVLVRQVLLPAGAYTNDRSDILMIADFQYPMSAMDMFFMEESVHQARVPIPEHAKTIEEHLGRRWRRWSWHRNGRWTPGVDGIGSHWAMIEARWDKERSQ